ncbi:MAG TPA: hemerythrin domain-containing protein [Candidatus Eisenbacteria bacterium]|nr:hemerythrin domain-containing protein [Candidatus Eisenbacteria bacterium]
MPGPIAQWLSADHARLEALFDRGTAGDASAYGEFRSGLLRHIGIEEKLLMPAAQRAQGGRPLVAAAQLRLDHGAIASLLVPTPTPVVASTLRRILAGHNQIEEGPDGVYAVCDGLLGDTAEGLVREMAAYPAVPVSAHNDGPEVWPAVRRALERAGHRLHEDG